MLNAAHAHAARRNRWHATPRSDSEAANCAARKAETYEGQNGIKDRHYHLRGPMRELRVCVAILAVRSQPYPNSACSSASRPSMRALPLLAVRPNPAGLMATCGLPGSLRPSGRSITAQRRYHTSQRCVPVRTMAAPVLQLKARANSVRFDNGPTTRYFAVGCGSP
jgi:hypothetical protein